MSVDINWHRFLPNNSMELNTYIPNYYRPPMTFIYYHKSVQEIPENEPKYHLCPLCVNDHTHTGSIYVIDATKRIFMVCEECNKRLFKLFDHHISNYTYNNRHSDIHHKQALSSEVTKGLLVMSILKHVLILDVVPCVIMHYLNTIFCPEKLLVILEQN